MCVAFFAVCFCCPLEIHGCMGNMQKGRLQQALRRGWGSPPWITQSPASHALPMDSLHKRTRGHDHHIEVDGCIAKRRHHGTRAEEATRAQFQEPRGSPGEAVQRRALGTPRKAFQCRRVKPAHHTRPRPGPEATHCQGPGHAKPSTPKANRYYSHQARRTKHHT